MDESPQLENLVTLYLYTYIYIYEACPEGMKPYNNEVETFIEEDTRYKKHCT